MGPPIPHCGSILNNRCRLRFGSHAVDFRIRAGLAPLIRTARMTGPVSVRDDNNPCHGPHPISRPTAPRGARGRAPASNDSAYRIVVCGGIRTGCRGRTGEVWSSARTLACQQYLNQHCMRFSRRRSQAVTVSCGALSVGYTSLIGVQTAAAYLPPEDNCATRWSFLPLHVPAAERKGVLCRGRQSNRP